MRKRFFAISVFAILAACGGSSSDSAGSNGTPSSNGSDGGTGSGPAAPPAGQGATFGTYIVLGDSISDKGGAGPFFYDLLLKNDDATYPAWKGKDLTTKYPGIQYVHGAVAGSVVGPYKDPATAGLPKLVDQIAQLGSSYPGDILVTITIGGNDLSGHASDAVLMQDANDKAQFAANLDAALGALTKAGRLGSGKVVVLETNIYDASDGKGNWRSGGGPRCPPFDTGSQLDTSTFAAWNQILEAAIAKTAGDNKVDLHGLFSGHGFNGQDNWYFSDCIHPNAKGHQQLRRELWRVLTGEAVGDQ